MKKLVVFWVVSLIVTFTISAHAGWLFYNKPEFRGKVIDAETKEPIEGTVVVVLYNRWEFRGPGGGNTLPMDAKETLTDKNGEFYFPAYSTLIGPLSRTSEASFIIYKPGYMSVTRIHGIQIPDERYFTVQKDMVGKGGEITYVDRWERTFSYKGPLGIMELKRAKTRAERIKTRPSGGGLDASQLPLFFKIRDEEYKHLYN
ncbi:MAG: hypothetical protein ABFD82_05695 [Syntrophaceae bacterium]